MGLMIKLQTIQLRSHSAVTLYRAFGWEVIPLYPKSKRPLIAWATPIDPVEVDTVFKEYPNANIAVVLGTRSRGLTCQDFEVEADYLEYYDKGHTKLEYTTIITTTPHGGIHVLAYSTNSFTKKIKVCEDHPLDVLGEGCMVVMPPSIVDGKKYETISSWRVDLEPDDNLLDSTVKKCRKLGWKISTSVKKTVIPKIIQGVPEGQRNESAFNYARHLLFKAELDSDTALFEMKRWNRQNKPPLPENELMGVLDSAMNYRPKTPINPDARWS